MAFREVSVVGVREVLRLWLMGHGTRTIARLAQVDRKTVRRYVEAAQAAGLLLGDEPAKLTDELVGEVLGSVRPGATHGRTRWRLGADVDAQSLPCGKAQRGSHPHQDPRAVSASHRPGGAVPDAAPLLRPGARPLQEDLGLSLGEAVDLRIDSVDLVLGPFHDPGERNLCRTAH